MSRIAAQFHVAAMPHNEAVRYLAVHKLPRVAVSLLQPGPDLERSVPATAAARRPQPALIRAGFRHLAPESLAHRALLAGARSQSGTTRSIRAPQHAPDTTTSPISYCDRR